MSNLPKKSHLNVKSNLNEIVSRKFTVKSLIDEHFYLKEISNKKIFTFWDWKLERHPLIERHIDKVFDFIKVNVFGCFTYVFVDFLCTFFMLATVKQHKSVIFKEQMLQIWFFKD